MQIVPCCNLSLCMILKRANLLLGLSLLASPNCPSFRLHFSLDFALVQVSFGCFLRIKFNLLQGLMKSKKIFGKVGEVLRYISERTCE